MAPRLGRGQGRGNRRRQTAGRCIGAPRAASAASPKPPCSGRLLPPQAQGQAATQQPQPLSPGQPAPRIGQGILSPAQVVRPACVVQRLRFGRQGQVEVPQQHHLQLPPPHPGPGPVNPTTLRFIPGPQRPSFRHQGRRRTEGMSSLGWRSRVTTAASGNPWPHRGGRHSCRGPSPTPTASASPGC